MKTTSKNYCKKIVIKYFLLFDKMCEVRRGLKHTYIYMHLNFFSLFTGEKFQGIHLPFEAKYRFHARETHISPVTSLYVKSRRTNQKSCNTLGVPYKIIA